MFTENFSRKIGTCTKESCSGDVIQEFSAADEGQKVTCSKCPIEYGNGGSNSLQKYLQEHKDSNMHDSSVQKEPQMIEFGVEEISKFEDIRERILYKRGLTRDTCPFCGENNIYLYYEPLGGFLRGIFGGEKFFGSRFFLKCDTCLAVWKSNAELHEDTSTATEKKYET